MPRAKSKPVKQQEPLQLGEDFTIKLALTVPQIDGLINLLARLPYSDVSSVIGDLFTESRRQYTEALAALESESQKGEK